ncbi:hypothetical protein PALB_16050 [Pseudoalteromonas luteoviolacea B = ATCC 29581]|nr:hypothetical protein PALB_16050 [Pseudoalteromonas luteoviolacea B = ATCC 29581]
MFFSLKIRPEQASGYLPSSLSKKTSYSMGIVFRHSPFWE